MTAVRFFATCAAGTEPALRDELSEIGIRRPELERGGIGFEGSFEQAMRVCLWSRVAVRVLLELDQFRAPNADLLYAGVRRVPWSEHVRPDRTIAVSVVSRESQLSHTMFVAQRTKDAIVDSLRERFGSRPNVDRDDPDVAVFVRLFRDVAGVHLDLAGEALHRRGWREPGAAAPLKETLAAAMLRLSGWDRSRPLVDPMCGSGTLLIEADHWARNVAPGLARARFGFERWASFDGARARELAALRAEAQAARRDSGPMVLGFDADPDVVARARRNVERARARVVVERARVVELRLGALGLAPGRGRPAAHVISNPPYGARLEADARMWHELSAALDRMPKSTRVSLLVAERPPLVLPKRHQRVRLYNGRIECELVSWEIGRARRGGPLRRTRTPLE